jgi:tRNA(Arg) A34 adenosine deaminase TadA
MFREVQKATTWPAAPAKIAYVMLKDGCYFATDAAGANGRIDPSFVVAAWCLQEGISQTIKVVQPLPQAWVVAFNGIKHLAKAQSVTLTLAEPKSGVAVALPGGDLYRIEIEGAPPQLAGKVLTDGDLFTPNASGFFNLPRLYAMAALFLEHREGAAVVALVTNATGFIVAKGSKSYGDVGCGHAEVKAIFSILGQLPDTGAIFSTLKPCTMCAGLLHATAGANFRKYWARNDPNSGADWTAVKSLTVPASFGLSASTQTSQNVRGIKLAGNQNFSDQFSSAWTHRADDFTNKPALQSAAFVAWRDKTITAGRVLVKQAIRVVEDKPGAAQTVEARVKSIGSIIALAARGDLFERWVSNAWKGGVDKATSEKIASLFTNSAENKTVEKNAKAASVAQDMGIIKFISEHSSSANLSQASHRALAAKFAKYGKSAQEIEQVTGVKGATPSSPKPATPAVQQVVNYLYEFLKG